MDMASPRLGADDSAETENEFKLTTSPKNQVKLLKILTAMDGVEKDSRQTKRLVSTYYDTEDRRLKLHGLTLRIRDKAGELEQTLKSTGTAVSGILARQEWTTSIDNNQPNLGIVGSSAVHDRIGLILPQELRPLFKSDVRRTSLIIHHSCGPGDAARVEVVFDKGRIVADKNRMGISEVELELLQGTRTALLDLANIIANAVPVVLSLGSKVDHGFELRDGTVPRAITAYSLSLPKNLSVEDGMMRIFRSALGHLLINRNAASSGKDIEGVHQVRVAIRRIKSAVTVFHHFLLEEQTAPIKTEIEWMMDTLGPARDLDVFLDEVVPAVMANRPDDQDLNAITKAAKKARTANYRKVRSMLSSSRYTKTMLRLALWIEEREWRETQSIIELDGPLNATAGKLLSRRYRKILKMGRKFKKLSAEQRHEIRIVLKKLRYTSEFFSSLYSKNQSKSYIASMKSLQNALGAANDVAVAEELTQSLVKSVRRGSKDSFALQSGAGKILGWHSRAAADAEVDIVSLWHGFAKSEPFWLST